MPAKKPRPDEKPQIERFRETAHEIGTDDTPEAFERAFDRVVMPAESLSRPSEKLKPS
jgi:hypothetical protein